MWFSRSLTTESTTKALPKYWYDGVGSVQLTTRGSLHRTLTMAPLWRTIGGAKDQPRKEREMLGRSPRRPKARSAGKDRICLIIFHIFDFLELLEL